MGHEPLLCGVKGLKLTLFTDHKPLEKLSTTHTKTFNRLQEAMLEFDFETKYYPGTDLEVVAEVMVEPFELNIPESMAK